MSHPVSPSAFRSGKTQPPHSSLQIIKNKSSFFASLKNVVNNFLKKRRCYLTKLSVKNKNFNTYVKVLYYPFYADKFKRKNLPIYLKHRALNKYITISRSRRLIKKIWNLQIRYFERRFVLTRKKKWITNKLWFKFLYKTQKRLNRSFSNALRIRLGSNVKVHDLKIHLE